MMDIVQNISTAFQSVMLPNEPPKSFNGSNVVLTSQLITDRLLGDYISPSSSKTISFLNQSSILTPDST